MIKVLYVNGNIMKRGGIEAFMMNYFRYIDKEQIHIDFLVHGFEKGVYDDEIISAGSKIYHVPTKSKKPVTYQKELRKLFQSEHFDIIHSHLDAMSGWILKIAKECGVSVRIAHSHNTDHLTSNAVKRAVNDYARKQIPKYATDLFACSQAAGKWLFGNNAKFTVINNAIDIEKFAFDAVKRKRMRRRLGWEDKFVIGHVGRFDYQKNQEFLISILPDVLNVRKNVHMAFVGDGNKIDYVRKLAQKERVQEACSFLGSRADVSELYHAFDIFVLPSRFEGLGIVAIEAQTNGLTCILSDTIPDVVRICDNVRMLPLNDHEAWIHSLVHCDGSRKVGSQMEIEKAGYSIKKSAWKLQKLYEKECERYEKNSINL